MYMLQKLKRATACLCAVILMLTLLPVPTEAAAKPVFTKSITSLYENSTAKGRYTYTLKNVIKGQKVKWSISGTGKSYVKLKNTTTKVTKTTVSNQLTVISEGKSASKNKTVQVTAKVYAKTGKLLYTVKSTTAKLKAKPTSIEIYSDTDDDEELLIGRKYQFRYKITPANSTSTNTWTAMDEEGNLIQEMTKTGAFTPTKEGHYTIVVQAKIGSKVIRSADKIVTVGRTMLETRQTAANQIAAVFSSSARGEVKKDNFEVSTAAGVPLTVEGISFSEDGTSVMVTTEENFKDGGEYILSDGKVDLSFTAKVGKPASIKILTTEVTVGKNTPVKYALYDKDGIEVGAAYPGSVEYTSKLTNGVLTKQNELYMSQVGDRGTVTITYTCSADTSLVLKYTGTVVCVAEEVSDVTNFTLTDSEKKPDYGKDSYQDETKAIAGENYYLHFRALDKNREEIAYDSVTFASSNPDVFLINNREDGTAKATAVCPGAVKVIVTAVYGGHEYTYSYDVTIEDEPYLKTLMLDENSITMSNRGGYGYKSYINVEGRDQYGKEIMLNQEIGTVTGDTKNPMAVYEAETNRIVIDASYFKAGTYRFQLAVKQGGKTAKVDFQVVVVEPPVNGTITYELEMDQPVMDLALDSGKKTSELEAEKSVTLRLAEYRGGIFYQYDYIQGVRISKDNLYYSTDLTQAGTEQEQVTGPAQMVTISALKITGQMCTLAETGLYEMEVSFYPGGTGTLSTKNVYLELTDSGEAPSIQILHTTADTNCSNALLLARNCLKDAKGQGEIIACSVAGTQQTGETYLLEKGEAVNIKDVTLQTAKTFADGKTLLFQKVIPVGKTLRNK